MRRDYRSVFFGLCSVRQSNPQLPGEEVENFDQEIFYAKKFNKCLLLLFSKFILVVCDVLTNSLGKLIYLEQYNFIFTLNSVQIFSYPVIYLF